MRQQTSLLRQVHQFLMQRVAGDDVRVGVVRAGEHLDAGAVRCRGGQAAQAVGVNEQVLLVRVGRHHLHHGAVTREGRLLEARHESLVARTQRPFARHRLNPLTDHDRGLQPGAVLGHQPHQTFAPGLVVALGAAFVVEQFGNVRDALLPTPDGCLHAHCDRHMPHHAHATPLQHLHQALVAFGRQVAVGLGEVEAHVGDGFAGTLATFKIAYAIAHQRRMDQRCTVDQRAANLHPRADQAAVVDAVAHP